MKDRDQSNPHQQELNSPHGDSNVDPFEEEKQRWLAQAKNKKSTGANQMRIKKGRVTDLSDLVFEENQSKSKSKPAINKSHAPDISNEVQDLLNSLSCLPPDSSTSHDPVNISADKLMESLGCFSDSLPECPPEISLPPPASKPIEVQKQEPEEISQAGWALLSLFGKKQSKSSKPDKGPTPSVSLFRSYGVKEEMNKKGLTKAKKPQMKFGKHKAKIQMEDTSFVDPNFMSDHKKAIFAVYDGHVDKNAALAAKKLIPKELEKQLKGLKQESRCLREVLRQTFLTVDRQLAEFEFEGSTATVALLWQINDEKFLQVANLGDSTAFLCRNGKAVMISQDHKVSDLTEQQRMKDAGLTVTEGQTRINGLAVSRSLGDHFVKQNAGMIIEPYIHESIKIEPTDSFFIVASDGLWDVMTGQEAIDTIKDMDNGEKMAKRLVAGALASSKCTDNITVIVVIL